MGATSSEVVGEIVLVAAAAVRQGAVAHVLKGNDPDQLLGVLTPLLATA